MKRNDITALHEKTRAELHTQLGVLQKQLAGARLQKTVGKLASPAQITAARTDIARIKTVLRAKELQEAK